MMLDVLILVIVALSVVLVLVLLLEVRRKSRLRSDLWELQKEYKEQWQLFSMTRYELEQHRTLISCIQEFQAKGLLTHQSWDVAAKLAELTQLEIQRSAMLKELQLQVQKQARVSQELLSTNIFVRIKHLVKGGNKQDDQSPPKFAEYLLYFLPKKERDPLLGDLEEEYHEVYQKFGKRKARIWYYGQVVQSFWPLIAHCIRKLIALGVVGWLGSLVRRLIP